MFGYIVVNQPELKIREYETYRSWYCGLCHSLKQGYGPVGQLTLTYDLTFLAILLSGLYEPETKRSYRRCGVHPTRRHLFSENEFCEYAADMNILMAYYKSLDDWTDDRRLSKGALAKGLSGSVRRLQKKYPEKCKRIEAAMEALSEGEKKGITDLDYMAGNFGKIMGELFVYRDDEWKDVLYRTGFFLGKFIYLMDAYEDLEEDRKKGAYNPLLPLADRSDFDAWCGQILTMMMSECARSFEVLPIVQDADILRNILYAGVWNRFEQVKDRRKSEEDVSKQ